VPRTAGKGTRLDCEDHRRDACATGLGLDEGASFAVFFGAGEGEGVAVGYYIDSWGEEAGGEDCFVDVLEGVGAFHLEGAHRAGEDDGDGEGVVGVGVLDEGLVEPVAGFTQGIGAVEDDDASAAVGIGEGVVLGV